MFAGCAFNPVDSAFYGCFRHRLVVFLKLNGSGIVKLNQRSFDEAGQHQACPVIDVLLAIIKTNDGTGWCLLDQVNDALHQLNRFLNFYGRNKSSMLTANMSTSPFFARPVSPACQANPQVSVKQTNSANIAA